MSTRTLESPEQFLAWSAAETLRTRHAVACALDVPYGPAALQTLDIYHPKERRSAGYPVLIDVHGGGWHRGSKNSCGYPAASLTPKGLVWVPIDYRLAPACTLADMVEDIRAALAMVHTTIAEYGGDPKRIYMSGHSAGAQLAAMTLVDGWHARHGVPADVVKGCCLVSGVFDIEGMVHAAGGHHSGFGLSLAEARTYTPPLNAPRIGCPVVFAYGGDESPELKRQTHAFAAAWTAAGLGTRVIECPGDYHFSIMRTLVAPDSELNRALVSMVGI